jgi:hypothetical protein
LDFESMSLEVWSIPSSQHSSNPPARTGLACFIALYIWRFLNVNPLPPFSSLFGRFFNPRGAAKRFPWSYCIS